MKYEKRCWRFTTCSFQFSKSSTLWRPVPGNALMKNALISVLSQTGRDLSDPPTLQWTISENILSSGPFHLKVVQRRLKPSRWMKTVNKWKQTCNDRTYVAQEETFNLMFLMKSPNLLLFFPPRPED